MREEDGGEAKVQALSGNFVGGVISVRFKDGVGELTISANNNVVDGGKDVFQIFRTSVPISVFGKTGTERLRTCTKVIRSVCVDSFGLFINDRGQ